MKVARFEMKSRIGAGKTPKAIVTIIEKITAIDVSDDGISTLVPSSTGSVKNIKTITRI
jgi:TRAP-type uncharacterized transport system substrate-binding protein